jgi:hypothetical protein
MNLGDFSRILGNHLEAKHLSQKSKSSSLEELLFQIYNSFSTKSKQNGLLLISCTDTTIGGIFRGSKNQFWSLEERKKFLYRNKMLREFLPRTIRCSNTHYPREASVCMLPVQKSCATYSHQAAPGPHLTQCPPLLVTSLPHRNLISLPLLSPLLSHGGRTYLSSPNPPHPRQSSLEDQWRTTPTSFSTIPTTPSSPKTKKKAVPKLLLPHAQAPQGWTLPDLLQCRSTPTSGSLLVLYLLPVSSPRRSPSFPSI